MLLIINTLVFNGIKTYSGIVRYTGLQDAVRIAISILASSVMLFLINTISMAAKSQFILSTSILIVYTSFSFLLLVSYRVLVKFLFAYAKNYKMKKFLILKNISVVFLRLWKLLKSYGNRIMLQPIFWYLRESLILGMEIQKFLMKKIWMFLTIFGSLSPLQQQSETDFIFWELNIWRGCNKKTVLDNVFLLCFNINLI